MNLFSSFPTRRPRFESTLVQQLCSVISLAPNLQFTSALSRQVKSIAVEGHHNFFLAFFLAIATRVGLTA
jgi:hypothetical protein